MPQLHGLRLDSCLVAQGGVCNSGGQPQPNAEKRAEGAARVKAVSAVVFYLAAAATQPDGSCGGNAAWAAVDKAACGWTHVLQHRGV